MHSWFLISSSYQWRNESDVFSSAVSGLDYEACPAEVLLSKILKPPLVEVTTILHIKCVCTL